MYTSLNFINKIGRGGLIHQFDVVTLKIYYYYYIKILIKIIFSNIYNFIKTLNEKYIFQIIILIKKLKRNYILEMYIIIKRLKLYKQFTFSFVVL
jgi:hypothetical protein